MSKKVTTNKERNAEVIHLYFDEGEHYTMTGIVQILKKKYPSITAHVVEGIIRRRREALKKSIKDTNRKLKGVLEIKEAPLPSMKDSLKALILEELKTLDPAINNKILEEFNSVTAMQTERNKVMGYLLGEAYMAAKQADPSLYMVIILEKEGGELRIVKKNQTNAELPYVQGSKRTEPE